MTRSEWEAAAQRNTERARTKYDEGDELLGEFYERRARACWSNSAYGTEDPSGADGER